jgi:zinc/manganese transport system substrate-binding protein
MRAFITFITILFSHIALATTSRLNIVAAENFYGQLAKEIGGNNTNVNSIVSNPNADPHLFAITTNTRKQIQGAQIIIYNGANYDGWMDQILQSQKNLTVINVAHLMHLDRPNVNPHLWYKPDTMPTLATYLAGLLIKIDTIHKTEYEVNLAKFLADNKNVQAKIAALKTKYNNTNVTATEPVFNYMAEAIGLQMQGLDFQWKIMNDTEPSPKMLSEYLDLLNKHKVKLLFYNNQVTEGTTQNILAYARKNNIPVVGINETMPQNISINSWLINHLNQTELALQMGSK